jgi:hypothetical protein
MSSTDGRGPRLCYRQFGGYRALRRAEDLLSRVESN